MGAGSMGYNPSVCRLQFRLEKFGFRQPSLVFEALHMLSVICGLQPRYGIIGYGMCDLICIGAGSLGYNQSVCGLQFRLDKFGFRQPSLVFEALRMLSVICGLQPRYGIIGDGRCDLNCMGAGSMSYKPPVCGLQLGLDKFGFRQPSLVFEALYVLSLICGLQPRYGTIKK